MPFPNVPLGILCVCFSSALLAQQPTLQITAPASNTSVTAGQTLGVTVSAGAGFTKVAVTATDPLGGAGPLVTPPYQFSMSIPSAVPYGQYFITAVGVDPTGHLSFSDPVPISVEPAVAVTSLTVQPQRLAFKFLGQQILILVSGTLADGSIVDLTTSVNTLYTTTNPQIAAVSSTGLVTAVGSGDGASINVQRGSLSVAIPVGVRAAVRGDLNGDGIVDQSDLDIITLALNTAANKPADARDLNGDGVINALDARILVTLCTRPGCATH